MVGLWHSAEWLMSYDHTEDGATDGQACRSMLTVAIVYIQIFPIVFLSICILTTYGSGHWLNSEVGRYGPE